MGLECSCKEENKITWTSVCPHQTHGTSCVPFLFPITFSELALTEFSESAFSYWNCLGYKSPLLSYSWLLRNFF